MLGRRRLLVSFATALKPSGGLFVRIGILVWFAFGVFLRPAFSQAPQTQSSKQEPTILELQKQIGGAVPTLLEVPNSIAYWNDRRAAERRSVARN